MRWGTWRLWGHEENAMKHNKTCFESIFTSFWRMMAMMRRCATSSRRSILVIWIRSVYDRMDLIWRTFYEYYIILNIITSFIVISMVVVVATVAMLRFDWWLLSRLPVNKELTASFCFYALLLLLDFAFYNASGNTGKIKKNHH